MRAEVPEGEQSYQHVGQPAAALTSRRSAFSFKNRHNPIMMPEHCTARDSP